MPIKTGGNKNNFNHFYPSFIEWRKPTESNHELEYILKKDKYWGDIVLFL